MVGTWTTVNATQVRRGGESRQIADNPAAERDNEVSAAETDVSECLEQFPSDLPALALLPWLHGERKDIEARGDQ